MNQTTQKLNFNQTWSMAVGGMIGGGIFSTLGVVVGIAGAWAWVSFIAAGLIALAAGYSFVKLASYYREGGGAFTFLRKINAEGLAGSMSWVLIVGYVLTNAVYAFTFGQYLAHIFDLGPWFARTAAVAIMILFIGLNLRGVGAAGNVEVFLVWFKVIVLLGLASWGLAEWQPAKLVHEVHYSAFAGILFGAASVFMAYEGFELLTYDYEDISHPLKTLPVAVLSAISVVILVYIAVALGTTMLIGADVVIAKGEIALALAGKAALGSTGLIIVTIAAAFSTGSAINATLFATARLAFTVAEDGELPAYLDHRNKAGIPDRAVIMLGAAAAVLAAIGTFNTLVEAASLAFLFTFAVVCGLAFYQNVGLRLITGFGALAAGAAAVTLISRLIVNDPIALIVLALIVASAVFARPFFIRRSNN